MDLHSGASKRGVVKVTMVTIDAETQGRNLRDDLAKVAEEAIPYPFKSEVGDSMHMYSCKRNFPVLI